ncbi:MAG: nucleotide exchange factor GrpE [Firmicutes bacterium]|nr:nucleotide exchange factor GrpE [Bacillota bacterium]
MKNKEMEKDLEKDQVTPEQEAPAEENAEAEGAGAADAEEVAEEKKEEPAATQEDEDMKTKYLRLAADFQNFKRRTEKEKSDIYAYANEKMALDLLDVIDNFERALVHQTDCKDEKMKEGMDLIFKQLQGVLEKNKITEIPALGEDFDPNVHNAVMTQASEEFESGKVSTVFQKGYKLNNKVIRPAMVIVAE